MKKILMLTAALMVFPVLAQAEAEQQVFYPPYIVRSVITQDDLSARENYILMQKEAEMLRRNHSNYRGRHGANRVDIPYHPGDYRDAYDRGELPKLGGTSQKTTQTLIHSPY